MVSETDWSRTESEASPDSVLNRTMWSYVRCLEGCTGRVHVRVHGLIGLVPGHDQYPDMTSTRT